MTDDELQSILSNAHKSIEGITGALDTLAPIVKSLMETLVALTKKVERLEETYGDKFRRLEAEVYKQGQPND